MHTETPRIKVFTLEGGPTSWNAALAAALDRPEVQIVRTPGVTPYEIAETARKADVTIAMPSVRRRTVSLLMAQAIRHALTTASKHRKQWLYLNNRRIREIPEYVAVRRPGCELSNCSGVGDVTEAVTAFIEDWLANVDQA